MSKSSKNRERREVVEQMRRDAHAAERRRTLTIFAICAGLAAVILVVAGIAVFNHNKKADELRNTDLTALGVNESAAGCTSVQEEEGTGTGQHVTTPVTYQTTPPAFGPHNPAPDTSGTHFYTADDRPPVEVLVHNLEHGWTIVWYDESIAGDSGAMDVLKATAAKFDGHGNDPSYNMIIAPWTSADGGGDPIPDGKHIAFTHWSIHHQTFDPNAWKGHNTSSGDDPIPSFGESVYCGEFSGEALSSFMTKYPFDDAPEGFLWHQG
ncbi:MAG TPA: DUF3105 domain-containing protein [Nocardioidaceae bacterium]|nr:DUF3105 domain-containing protein [Nocardioidaceae bacterium]